ncbi:MAG: hypothetical protein RJA57_841 [Bacteroidota bacterium]
MKPPQPHPMGTELIFATLGIGLIAGLLSGLIGIGGGIIMVPALIFFLGYGQHQAQGTSLSVITLPVVLLATIYYHQECRKMGTPVDLRVVALLAGGFVLGALGGSKLALTLDAGVLKKIFALVLFYTGIKMMGWDTAAWKGLKNLF